MNTIKNLLVALVLFLDFFVGSASAVSVTVSIVPGGNVGLSDGGYYAGFVTLNINGKEYPAMMDNLGHTALDNRGYQNDSTTWNGIFYTYNDIKNISAQISAQIGYNLNLTADYSKASWFLTNGMIGYGLKDNLWSASYNEMVWDTLIGANMWIYSDREYPSAGSGITMHDGYNMDVANGSPDPNYDFNSFMGVLNVPVGADNTFQFLVFTQKNGTPIPKLPIPPAIWLFGSGLIGLTFVARRDLRGRKICSL